MFNTRFALLVPRRYATPAAVAAAGFEGLTRLARLARVRVQRPHLAPHPGLGPRRRRPPTATRSCTAPAASPWTTIASTKRNRFSRCERELVAHLVQTPYVRLLALPGINVVTAGEFAGEAGPMAHYADGAGHHRACRACTPGAIRATEVDLASGRLARRGNRRLRQALLQAADTLVRCNDHFRVLAAQVARPGEGPPRGPCAGGRAVRPDRLPDGDRQRRVRSSRVPEPVVCYEQVE